MERSSMIISLVFLIFTKYGNIERKINNIFLIIVETRNRLSDVFL